MKKEKQIKIVKDKRINFENSVLVSNKTIEELTILKGKTFIIYLRLLDIQQHKGYYVGSQKDLSKEINISLPTLNKYLKILKEKGFLQTIRQGRKKGTIYIVNLEKSA